MGELFQQFGNVIQNILPGDPFIGYIQKLQSLPYLGWLNWFIPVRELLTIFGIWLGAYIAFLAYQLIYRWLKVIQG